MKGSGVGNGRRISQDSNSDSSQRGSFRLRRQCEIPTVSRIQSQEDRLALEWIRGRGSVEQGSGGRRRIKFDEGARILKGTRDFWTRDG